MPRLFLSVFLGSMLTAGPFVSLVRAEASAGQQSYQKASDELSAADYAAAVKDFQDVIAQFPSENFIDDAKYRLGLAQLFSGHPDPALATFAGLIADPQAPADLKASAVFYSGQAAFAQAAAVPEAQRAAPLDKALGFFSKYLTDFPKGDQREAVLFFRAQTYFFRGNFDGEQKDIAQLLADYPQSSSRTDYLYWSGRGYAAQAAALLEKGDRAQALAVGQKGLDAFHSIGQSSEAAVAQNDAQLEVANLELALAPNGDGIDAAMVERAIADYEKVLSKETLIPLQEQGIAGLSRRITEASRSGNKGTYQTLLDLRRREQARLAALKEGADPAVDAFIREADALNRLKRYEEARVVLDYVKPFAADAESRQRISYNTIISYAMQGLTAQADAALQKHTAEFAKDPNAQNLRYILAQQLRRGQQYAAAEEQFRKSLAESPQAKFADPATLGLAAVLAAQKKYAETEALLTDYLKTHAAAPTAPEARYQLGLALAAQKKTDPAVEQMRLVAADAKAGTFRADASLQEGFIRLGAGQPDQAVPLLQKTAADFPRTEQSVTALFYLGVAQEQKKDSAAAAAAFAQALQEAPPGSAVGPAAGERLVRLRVAAGQLDEAAAIADKLAADHGSSPQAASASLTLAQALERQRNYEAAAARLAFVAGHRESPGAPFAGAQMAVLWMNAARALGAYAALTDDEKKQWQDFTGRAEKAALASASAFPAAPETSAALEELVKLYLAKVDSGQITLDQAIAYFTDLSTKAADPQLKGRFELARIAVIDQRGHRDVSELYAAAFKALPELIAGPQDLARYGAALLAARKYAEATTLFTRLGQTFPKDPHAQADSLYGLGAAQLGLGKTTEADVYFDKLEKAAPWSDNIWQAKLGRGAAAEERHDTAGARAFYQQVIMSSAASSESKARGLFGFAHTLETEGKLVDNPAAPNEPNAANNYLKIDALFDSAKETAAEGLWRAGQVFEKANQPLKAKGAYQDLVKKYPQSPFAAQGADRLKALGG